MKVLRDVHVWGDLNNPGAEGDPTSTVSRMFVRASRDVCPVYSGALALQQVENRFITLHLILRRDDMLGRRRRVVVHVHESGGEGMETALVLVPPGLADVSHPKAALLVLEVLDAAVHTLGAARGWNLTSLDAAHDLARRMVVARHGMRDGATSGFRVEAVLS